MIYIKNFGERNSGNNFLRRLINRNVTNAVLLRGGINGNSGWVHGYPDIEKLDKFNQNDDTLIIICMVRNLKDWLSSMFHRSYHIKRKNSFKKFINTPLVSREARLHHNVNIDERETKNIFKVRYGKYRAYKKLMEDYNVVLVKLSYLQENPKEFLLHLQDNFGIELKDKIDTVKEHTKTGRAERNDSAYKKKEIPDDIVDSKVDKEIEKEIENLTIEVSLNV